MGVCGTALPSLFLKRKKIHAELADSKPSSQRSPYPTRRRKAKQHLFFLKNKKITVFIFKFARVDSSFCLSATMKSYPSSNSVLKVIWNFLSHFFFSSVSHLSQKWKNSCHTFTGASAGAKSSTLPLPHRLNVDRACLPKERERDGYYRWELNIKKVFCALDIFLWKMCVYGKEANSHFLFFTFTSSFCDL